MDSYNDFELVSLAQEHNEEAVEFLYQKYLPLMNKKSNKYFKYLKNKGVEFEDLIQECTIGFEEAISSFNEHDETSFYTFVSLCMDRQLMSELTKQNRDKHKLLNEAIPLETLEDCERLDLINYIQDNKNNPLVGLISDESFKELYEKVIGELTDFEECVFRLKLQSFNYKEIAYLLDKSDKSIDNAIQRIKIKVKNII